MTESERIALAEEADSLPLHVKMCAFRHSQIRTDIQALEGRLENQKKMLSQIRNGVWAAALSLAGMAGSVYVTGVTVMRQLAGH